MAGLKRQLKVFRVNKEINLYQPFLRVCVIYHQDTEFDINLPQIIYDCLTRDIRNPLARGLGIPVFFLDAVKVLSAESFKSFLPEKAYHTVYIILIGQKMVISPQWRKFINNLWTLTKSTLGKDLIIPVDLDDTGKNININMQKEITFLNMKNFSENKKITFFRIYLVHELCRLLLRDFKKANMKDTPSSVNLFLSHAKVDGVVYTEKFRDFIHKKSGLKSFFDVYDIPIGSKFEDVIKDDIEKSTMLVFQSDKFSSREWCRREVLHAKKYGCPIIVIDCLKKGENRSFPYMANVPTIRWEYDSEDRLYDILLLSLRETLYNLYNIQHLNTLIKINEEKSGSLPWYRAPEVLTCLHLRENPVYSTLKALIYPDPPLGIEELNLLKNSMMDVSFVTPTQLLGKRKNSDASVKNSSIIAISISDSPNIPKNGLTSHHLNDTMVEFARYLLAAGTTIMYGGDLRAGGFTHILFDLVSKHSEAHLKDTYKIISYLAWPFSRDLTEKMQAELANVADIRKIDLPDDLRANSEKTIDFNYPYDRYLISRGLIKMRHEMSEVAHGRILIGGQTTNYLGRYPGIVEEALFALQAKKPVYLIGAFGGATKIIIDALKGETPELLTLQKMSENAVYNEFYKIFNEEIAKFESLKKETINFDVLVSFFQNTGIDGLNNGLTREENIRLFETVNIHEMVSLVLRGLFNCKLI